MFAHLIEIKYVFHLVSYLLEDAEMKIEGDVEICDTFILWKADYRHAEKKIQSAL